jgi:4-diphosphocytidyl-2-C-methyl-D-erythritol kinase
MGAPHRRRLARDSQYISRNVGEMESGDWPVLVIAAPAKVNLALEVVRRRDDGWHDIESVLVPIDWHDLIGVRLRSAEATMRVTGSASRGVPGGPDGPPARDNLAARAAAALTAAVASGRRTTLSHGAGTHERCLDIWLDKRVPVAAGLGGGSADAAAVLRGGSRLLRGSGVIVDLAELSHIAETLGSDVPALLAGHAVHVSGRGEQLTPVQVPPLHLVVVFLASASTGDAYKAVQPEEWSDGTRVRTLVAALAGGDHPPDGALGSALETAALRVNDELALGAARLRRNAPDVAWHMTGSGGAFFAVRPSVAAARDLAAELRARGFAARACRTFPGVPGAG